MQKPNNNIDFKKTCQQMAELQPEMTQVIQYIQKIPPAKQTEYAERIRALQEKRDLSYNHLNRLFDLCIPVAEAIARDYHLRTGIEYEDVFQEACSATMKILQKYQIIDSDYFIAYLTMTIKRELIKHLPPCGRAFYISSHFIEKIQHHYYSANTGGDILDLEQMNSLEIYKLFTSQKNCREEDAVIMSYILPQVYSLDTMVEENDQDQRLPYTEDNTDKIIWRDNIERLYNALGCLKEQEKHIIISRYGLGGINGKTLQEIGNESGVTRERVRQIENKAIIKLAQYYYRHNQTTYAQLQNVKDKFAQKKKNTNADEGGKVMDGSEEYTNKKYVQVVDADIEDNSQNQNHENDLGKTHQYIGVIYILVNPAFPNFVKIGYTDDVEKKLKSLNKNDGLPDLFHVYAIYKVKKTLEDLRIHNLIKKLDSDLRYARNKNFYEMTPEKAYGMLAAIAEINGDENLLKKNPLADDFFKEKKHQEKNEFVAPMVKKKRNLKPTKKKKQRVSKPPLTFEMLGIPVGSTLVYEADPSITCETYDNKSTVVYQGEVFTMSGFVVYLKGGGSWQGSKHLLYNGKKLTQLRKEMEEKEEKSHA